MDSNGVKVVSYSYDPRGKPLDTTISTVGSSSECLAWETAAEVNPLRYRGYYYDTETGFYYLQSRYYDPEICRFINADSRISTSQGLIGFNSFAYCLNNPIIASDPTGRYRFIEGWTPQGQPQLNECSETPVPSFVEHSFTIVKGLFYATTIDAGIGVGFGGSLELGGAEADLKYAHNYLELSLDNGELEVRSSDKTSSMISIPIFSAGYEKANYGKALDMDIYESDSGKWQVSSKLGFGIGGSLYMGWLGGSANVYIDLIDFFTYISDNW